MVSTLLHAIILLPWRRAISSGDVYIPSWLIYLVLLLELNVSFKDLKSAFHTGFFDRGQMIQFVLSINPDSFSIISTSAT